MPRERILVTVKTYPTLSKKYCETVCTAGLREDGSWVRLYPIETHKDPRPESRHLDTSKEIKVIGHVGREHDWEERRRLVLKKGPVVTSLKDLIESAKQNECSLATFKPERILEFEVKPEEERNWDPAQFDAAITSLKQRDLFENDDWKETFRIVEKLPYSFFYRFTDVDGQESRMKILDWEIGALYWNCLRKWKMDEKAAVEDVRKKYWTEFIKKDLHFFLGTTLQWHSTAPNPWTIIGVFPIPVQRQLTLDL
ncbi:MAG: hypothetical protein CVU65_14825 [Deltaproteobacteria bacterium HGW-Deltaproteobacteria-22]|nr:MAG: hypothetical protein CVU65_14825 [Deltaproteobacteria bacterium HGW-Deltaproteobacteria-22]